MTGKVLIIEDDAKLLEFTSEAFERANYRCSSAADGWGALDLITKYNYDVIITDIKHPGPDGIEILRQCRQLFPKTPVVVLSGYPNVEYSDECLRSGAFAYLCKPCPSEIIIDTIKRAISSRVLVSTDPLSEQDRVARYRAVIASGRLGGSDSIPDLIKTLADKNDPILCGLAATALGEIGNPAAVPVLTASLGDENRDVRVFTTLALCKIGDPSAVPALIVALRDEHWAVRKRAASGLGKIGDPASIPVLIKALIDEDWSVSASAAEALGKIGDPSALAALIAALRDRDQGVRQSAGQAVSEIHDAVRAHSVRTLLAGLGNRDRDMLIEQCIGALHDMDLSNYLGTFVGLGGLSWRAGNPLQNLDMLAEILAFYLDRQDKLYSNTPVELEQWTELTGKQKKRLKHMPEEITTLAQCVQEFASLHEIERHGTEIDINALLTLMVSVFRTNPFFAQRVDAELSLTNDLPKVKVSGRDIVLAIFHLFLNGVRAVGKAPKRELIIETYTQNGDTIVRITDSGPGLPEGVDPESLFNLFESRWQEPDSEAFPSYRHLGFGLYAARQLLLPHGFTVSIERTDGGTSALIRMPISPAQALDKIAPETVPSRTAVPGREEKDAECRGAVNAGKPGDSVKGHAAHALIAALSGEERNLLIERGIRALYEKDRLSYDRRFLQGFVHNANGPLESLTVLTGPLTSGLELQDRLFRGSREKNGEWRELMNKQRERLTQMREQVSSLADHFRNLNRLYGIEWGDVIDINALVECMVKLFTANLSFAGHVQTKLRLAKDLPEIKALGKHIVPALFHLLQNTITALEESTRKEIIVETYLQAGEIMVRITDSGCGPPEGLDSEILFNLFESRWPEPDCKTSAEQHLGFGLYAARQLLLPYGFTVSLEETYYGTSALLRIPLPREFALAEIGDPAATPAMIAALSDKHPGIRSCAAKALGRIGDRTSVPALIAVLGDKSRRVRQNAIKALGKVGDPSAVPALIEALSGKTPHNFPDADAAEALGKIGDPSAVAGLAEALKVWSSDLRGKAIDALGIIGDPAAVPALIDVLKDGFSEPWHRDSAARILERLGARDEAVSAMIAALQDKASSDRYNAAFALCFDLVDQAAVPAMKAALSDEDPRIRRYAAQFLGMTRDSGVVPALIDALSDEDLGVRREAAEALGKTGNPSAVQALVSAYEKGHVRWAAIDALDTLDDSGALAAISGTLNDKVRNIREHTADASGSTSLDDLRGALSDESWVVRCGAAEALGRTGDPAAVPVLAGTLKDKDEDVRSSVVWALGMIGGSEAARALVGALQCLYGDASRRAGIALCKLGSIAVPALAAALNDEESRSRCDIADVIGRIGDPAGVPALTAALRDEEDGVRSHAAKGLGKIGDPKAVPALSAALWDPGRSVRSDAAEALGKIGDPAAVPALAVALRDEESYVRSGAARALGEIEDPAAVPALRVALKDEEDGVRKSVNEALARIERLRAGLESESE